MILIIIILSIYAFIKTIAYGIFEYKDNSNKVGGIVIFLMGIASLIAPTAVYYITFIQ